MMRKGLLARLGILAVVAVSAGARPAELQPIALELTIPDQAPEAQRKLAADLLDLLRAVVQAERGSRLSQWPTVEEAPNVGRRIGAAGRSARWMIRRRSNCG